MVISPRVRGFICTAAHPKGCEQAVAQQIQHVENDGPFAGPKNVLIIGASTGYGLATRIATTFGAGAKTIGVFYEKEASEKRSASAGWYNTAAFEKLAHEKGHYAKSINGDAFSKEIKQQTAELIRQDLGKVDLVVYSLASPRRTHPDTGEVYNSTLKPVGNTYKNKTVDPIRGEVKDVVIEPANEEEINNTIAVMGGEDWKIWIDFLSEQDLLSDNIITVAYTYIGPEMTHAIYKKGTIGHAKDDLQATAYELNDMLANKNGRAFLSVNKALVTQASAAIPVVPLYISILYKLMKAKGNHEGCIEQMQRMLKQKIYVPGGPITDAEDRVRCDDYEMEADIQQEIAQLWPKINTENLAELTDIQGYQDDFYRLFGFRFDEVDYEADIDPNVEIESLQSVSEKP